MNINYDKKRIVAVLDVMGFKKLLTSNPENLKKLNEYFGLVGAYDAFGFYHPNEPAALNLDLMAVSDAIVVSAEINNEWSSEELLSVTAEFLKCVTSLQGSLALSGIWVRGAVTIGDLYLDTDRSILVGEAFVTAHNLEPEANYPRIIIDPRILRLFSMSAPKLCKKLQKLGAPLLDFCPSESASYSQDDFMQLDWFGNTLGDSRQTDAYNEKYKMPKKPKFKRFFDDFKERQTEDAAVFQKAQKLLVYVQRSFWENIKKYGPHKTVDNVYIYDAILDLTGIETFSWEMDFPIDSLGVTGNNV
ncbi:hypothetical protein [Bdellovibrio sp. HCB-162]|uniref:hypothetical protein n=1 Tax=Bdellovibrio sp. HCB-162 TaxID=3394234 RepID=UPI0039BC79DA